MRPTRLERAGRDDDEYPRDRDQHDGREGDDEVDGHAEHGAWKPRGGRARRSPAMPRRRRAGSPRSWGQRPAPWRPPAARRTRRPPSRARTAKTVRAICARGGAGERGERAQGVGASPLCVLLSASSRVCGRSGCPRPPLRAVQVEPHEQQYLRPSKRSERSQCFPAASAAAAPCRRRSPRSRDVALRAANASRRPLARPCCKMDANFGPVRWRRVSAVSGVHSLGQTQRCTAKTKWLINGSSLGGD